VQSPPRRKNFCLLPFAFCLLPSSGFAGTLPSLYWEGPVVRATGLQRVFVPAEQTGAWRATGVDAIGVDASRSGFVKLLAPGVQYRMNVASATNVPWIDANGWRILRAPSRKYFYESGPVDLDMAEAYAYDADAVVRAADLDVFGRMLEFLRRIDRPRMPALANIGAIDDGSAIAGEALNLFSRRNLLFQIVRAPDAKYDLNVRLNEARNPSEFAAMVRQKLGDDKRLLRLYGSEVVIARLTGEGEAARVHLLNYSNRKVIGLRVRVRGEYARGALAAFGSDGKLVDYQAAEGATEFSVPEMGAYAVIDLQKR
jgi:hypothetical protein